MEFIYSQLNNFSSSHLIVGMLGITIGFCVHKLLSNTVNNNIDNNIKTDTTITSQDTINQTQEVVQQNIISQDAIIQTQEVIPQNISVDNNIQRNALDAFDDNVLDAFDDDALDALDEMQLNARFEDMERNEALEFETLERNARDAFKFSEDEDIEVEYEKLTDEEFSKLKFDDFEFIKGRLNELPSNDILEKLIGIKDFDKLLYIYNNYFMHLSKDEYGPFIKILITTINKLVEREYIHKSIDVILNAQQYIDIFSTTHNKIKTLSELLYVYQEMCKTFADEILSHAENDDSMLLFMAVISSVGGAYLVRQISKKIRRSSGLENLQSELDQAVIYPDLVSRSKRKINAIREILLKYLPK